MATTLYPDYSEFPNLVGSVHAYSHLSVRTDDGIGIECDVHRQLVEADLDIYRPTVSSADHKHIAVGEQTLRWMSPEEATAAAARAGELAFPGAVFGPSDTAVPYIRDPWRVVLVLEGHDLATATLVDGFGEGEFRWNFHRTGLEPLLALLSTPLPA